MAKAKLTYAHLGDQAFPSEGGKLNLIGIFAGVGNPGSLSLRQYPGVYPRLALAVGLTTTAKKLPVEVTFRGEDGTDVVPPFNGSFDIQQPAGKQEGANVNFTLNFDSFQLAKPGKYFITLESGDEELAEIEMNAAELPAQTA